jgi:hypothetical protein
MIGIVLVRYSPSPTIYRTVDSCELLASSSLKYYRFFQYRVVAHLKLKFHQEGIYKLSCLWNFHILKILEWEVNKERFLILLANKMKRSSSIKFKDLYRHREKGNHSNIQWIKDWSTFPQQEQNLGRLPETLPLLITIVVLYL